MNKSLLRQLFFVAILLVLGGCSSLLYSGKWPEAAPNVGAFVKVHRADGVNAEKQSLDNYLDWVSQFYSGNTLQRQGWLDVSEQVLNELNASADSDVANRLEDLGQKIAGEWAKKNQFRKINTRHVVIWGDALRTAAETGEITDLINNVEADVDALLADQLLAKAIKDDRYYEPEFNEFF